MGGGDGPPWYLDESEYVFVESCVLGALILLAVIFEEIHKLFHHRVVHSVSSSSLESDQHHKPVKRNRTSSVVHPAAPQTEADSPCEDNIPLVDPEQDTVESQEVSTKNPPPTHRRKRKGDCILRFLGCVPHHHAHKMEGSYMERWFNRVSGELMVLGFMAVVVWTGNKFGMLTITELLLTQFPLETEQPTTSTLTSCCMEMHCNRRRLAETSSGDDIDCTEYREANSHRRLGSEVPVESAAVNCTEYLENYNVTGRRLGSSAETENTPFNCAEYLASDGSQRRRKLGGADAGDKDIAYDIHAFPGPKSKGELLGLVEDVHMHLFYAMLLYFSCIYQIMRQCEKFQGHLDEYEQLLDEHLMETNVAVSLTKTDTQNREAQAMAQLTISSETQKEFKSFLLKRSYFMGWIKQGGLGYKVDGFTKYSESSFPFIEYLRLKFDDDVDNFISFNNSSWLLVGMIHLTVGTAGYFGGSGNTITWYSRLVVCLGFLSILLLVMQERVQAKRLEKKAMDMFKPQNLRASVRTVHREIGFHKNMDSDKPSYEAAVEMLMLSIIQSLIFYVSFDTSQFFLRALADREKLTIEWVLVALTYVVPQIVLQYGLSRWYPKYCVIMALPPNCDENDMHYVTEALTMWEAAFLEEQTGVQNKRTLSLHKCITPKDAQQKSSRDKERYAMGHASAEGSLRDEGSHIRNGWN